MKRGTSEECEMDKARIRSRTATQAIINMLFRERPVRLSVVCMGVLVGVVSMVCNWCSVDHFICLIRDRISLKMKSFFSWGNDPAAEVWEPWSAPRLFTGFWMWRWG